PRPDGEKDAEQHRATERREKRAEGHDGVGWERRKHVLEAGRERHGGVQRQRWKGCDPGEHALHGSAPRSTRDSGNRDARNALRAADPTHAFVALALDADVTRVNA